MKTQIKIFTAVTLALFILPNCYRTYQRNKIWLNDYTLWGDTVKKSPNKPRPNNNFGTALFQRGDIDGAQVYFERAYDIANNDKDAINNIGYCHFVRGNYGKAIEYFEHSLRIAPTNTNVMINLGAALVSNGQYHEGLGCYLSAIRRNKVVEGEYLMDKHLSKFAAVCQYLMRDPENYELVADYTGKVNEVIGNRG